MEILAFLPISSGIVAVQIPDSSADSISLSASGYIDTSLFASNSSLGEQPVEVVLKEKSSVYELPNMVVSTSINGDKNIAALSSTKFTSFDIKTAAGTADDISRYIGIFLRSYRESEKDTTTLFMFAADVRLKRFSRGRH